MKKLLAPLDNAVGLAVAATVMIGIATAMVWFYAPIDVDGLNQKIFYFHVPIALTAYATFGWGAWKALVHLWKKKPGADLESYVASTVRINYAGRLVIFLLNRELMSANEASTYVREEDLKSLVSKAVDTGTLSPAAVVLRPLLFANTALLALFAAWAGIVDVADLGIENGFVRINAVPWAEVMVNGETYDVTPFAKPIVLPPGRHSIEFRNDYFEPQREIVDVEPGVTQSVRVELARKR